MSDSDKRLIEEYIPIKAISAEASREKSIRHGHISTLHLWWARRPLVASRAAVFAALVSADAKPQIKAAETDKEPMTMTKFMVELCKWKAAPEVIEEARRLIREHYPDAPPKVLDMFAGGGAIPLEALRLGCEAYAVDLNPVAHIIQLATLVYPQKYGAKLAEDVKKWGEWVLEQVRAEVGDLYPLIPDPEWTEEKAQEAEDKESQSDFIDDEISGNVTFGLDTDDEEEDIDEEEVPDASSADVPPGYLQPVAYLWTRTVTCPNPSCGAVVPLVRQTWLKKKKRDYVALNMKPHPTENRMAFYRVHSTAESTAEAKKDFGFDPAGFSQRGNSTCYRCGATVNTDYVRQEGKAKRIGAQMMATVCVRLGERGKVYLSPDEVDLPLPDEGQIQKYIEQLTDETGITPPDEEIETNPRSMDNEVYGYTTWSSLFTQRQILTLLTYVKYTRSVYEQLYLIASEGYAKAVVLGIACVFDKTLTRSSTLSPWDSGYEKLVMAFGRQAIPMVWDYAEANVLATGSGSFSSSMNFVVRVLDYLSQTHTEGHVSRSSSTDLIYDDSSIDVIITDPPYYDNVTYSNLSDFFYVWLKRLLGHLWSEHFVGELTPKKKEIIVANYRHSDKLQAREFYEQMMAKAFIEANRVLKRNSIIVIVYAHKTTTGWSTLVDSLRTSGFSITEAWPLDTELTGHLKKNLAALASSIFLVGRKRENGHTAYFQEDIMPEMQRIVNERVRFFLQVGITGADLNIAAVGAGLAPYTRYARVELPNGEELSASAYLDEVQAEVVRVLLGEAASVDDNTRYYLSARQYYGEAWVAFDEANNLARAVGPELDTGPDALTRGRAALVEKQGSKVRLRDYRDRGQDADLGLPSAEQPRAPLIDVLHRLLWLAEHDNGAMGDFLNQTGVDKYKLRVVAENLKGRALAAEPTPGAVRDERTIEQRMIDTLLAAWRRVVDEGKML